MKILGKATTFIILWIGIWGTLSIILTMVFCMLFYMHPSDCDYIRHRDLLNNIGLSLIPITFIVTYIINKKCKITMSL